MYHTEPPTDKTIREWYMNSSREGLMNNPVYCIRLQLMLTFADVGNTMVILIKSYKIIRKKLAICTASNFDDFSKCGMNAECAIYSSSIFPVVRYNRFKQD